MAPWVLEPEKADWTLGRASLVTWCGMAAFKLDRRNMPTLSVAGDVKKACEYLRKEGVIEKLTKEGKGPGPGYYYNLIEHVASVDPPSNRFMDQLVKEGVIAERRVPTRDWLCL